MATVPPRHTRGCLVAMIHYLVSRRFAKPIQEFLSAWAQTLSERLRVLFYEDLPKQSQLDPGIYIFADLERLTPSQMRLAKAVAARLNRAGGGFRILNDPRIALTRFSLMERLHKAGINQFRGYRDPRCDLPCRYPVFLRSEGGHSGALSEILHSPDELRIALRRISEDPCHSRRRLLAVEFCDTRDADGLYRKYSTLRIGDRLLPRHLFFSSQWMIKSPKLTDDGKAAEELEYVRTRPHQDQLWRVFQLAGIEYGRVDYALLDGQVQVWEINTNPGLTPPLEQTDPRRHKSETESAERIVQQFHALADHSATGRPIRTFSPGTLHVTLPIRFRALKRRFDRRLAALQSR